MRINLSTHLKTRTGDTTKDARLKNSYAEVRGEQSVVRHRPSARGGVAVGTGTAQGGIGLNINGTDTFIGFWGDTLTSYTGSGTSWNAGASYSIGDHVSYGWVDYWAVTDHSGSQPPGADWSTTYVPAVPFQASSWASYTNASSIRWYGIAYGAGKYVTVGKDANTSNANIECAYSTDGTSWTNTTLGSEKYWRAVSYGGGAFVALGDGIASKSSDGITWANTSLTGTTIEQFTCYNMIYADSKYIAVGQRDITSNYAVAYSADGVTWNGSQITGETVASDIAYSGSAYVVTTGTILSAKTTIQYSTDLASWAGYSMPSSALWIGVAYGNGKFVAIAYNSNKAAYSADGQVWTASTLPSSGLWSEIEFGNGYFVAIGSGVCATSTDGITWSALSMSSGSYGGLAAGDKRFVATKGYIFDSAGAPVNGIEVLT